MIKKAIREFMSKPIHLKDACMSVELKTRSKSAGVDLPDTEV